MAMTGCGLAGGSGLLINSYRVLLASRACLGIALAGIFTAINVLIFNMYEFIKLKEFSDFKHALVKPDRFG